MKRVHILLLLLVVLGGAVLWMEDQKREIIMPTPLPTPVQERNVVSGSTQGTGDEIEVASGAMQSGGIIDDTELPLDQNAQQDSGTEQVTDPEVEEIIDLLEELIAESETAE